MSANFDRMIQRLEPEINVTAGDVAGYREAVYGHLDEAHRGFARPYGHTTVQPLRRDVTASTHACCE